MDDVDGKDRKATTITVRLDHREVSTRIDVTSSRPIPGSPKIVST